MPEDEQVAEETIEVKPAEVVTQLQAQGLLHAFAKLAEKHPDKPGMLLELAKAHSVEALKASLMLATPETWRHALGSFLDAQETDEVRFLACFSAVVFIQGLAAGTIIGQQKGSGR